MGLGGANGVAHGAISAGWCIVGCIVGGCGLLVLLLLKQVMLPVKLLPLSVHLKVRKDIGAHSREAASFEQRNWLQKGSKK